MELELTGSRTKETKERNVGNFFETDSKIKQVVNGGR